jgi:hypothetical protein
VTEIAGALATQAGLPHSAAAKRFTNHEEDFLRCPAIAEHSRNDSPGGERSAFGVCGRATAHTAAVATTIHAAAHTTTTGTATALTRTARAFGFLAGRNETLTLRLFAGELAGAADGLGLLARFADGGFFVSLPQLHLAEDAFALQLLLEDPKGLVDIVVADEDLHALSNWLLCAFSARGFNGAYSGKRSVLI